MSGDSDSKYVTHLTHIETQGECTQLTFSVCEPEHNVQSEIVKLLIPVENLAAIAHQLLKAAGPEQPEI